MSEAIVEVRGNRKERVGVVVSDVQDKTIVVKVDRRTRRLSRFGKSLPPMMRRTKRRRATPSGSWKPVR